MTSGWSLTLYVSGAAPRSIQAITTVRAVCDEQPDRQLALTVVDAADHPGRALRDDVVALPTLVKQGPGPVRHLVGNLTDPAHVRGWLDQVLGAGSSTVDDGSRP